MCLFLTMAVNVLGAKCVDKGTACSSPCRHTLEFTLASVFTPVMFARNHFQPRRGWTSISCHIPVTHRLNVQNVVAALKVNTS